MLRPLFGRLAYPAAATASLVVFLPLSWYLGLAHLPTWFAIVPFLVLLGVGLARRWYARAEWEGVAKWDLVFLLFFLFVLELRFFNPYVSHYSEQFMDLAFVASIIRNPVVTPLDPWFAGGTLDVYYYLGHWLMAQLGLIAGVPARVVFNLILPTVFGLSAVNCYLIGHLLLDRYRWLPLSLLVFVNPTAIHQLVLRRALVPALDHARHAILHNYTEFPLYTAILGDPHALVIGMVNQLFLIALMALAWTRWSELSSRQRWVLMGLSALSLGAMPGINSWEVLVYGPLLVGFGLLLWWKVRSGPDTTGSRQASLYPVLVPCAAFLVYLPNLLQMQQGSIHGISLVLAPSNPVEFLMTLGFFFLVVAVAIASFVRRQPSLLLVAVPFLYFGYYSAAIAAVLLAYMLVRLRRTGRIEDILVLAGLLIVLMVELVYLREALGGDSFRMNTMHKFYFIAWILLGVGCAGIVGRWLSARPGLLAMTPAARTVVGLVAVAALLAFPVVFQPDVGRDLLGIRFAGEGRSLDGLAYLDNEHPGDAEAVRFLERYPHAGGIVEAVGDDFGYGSPISSFTGIPTIMGKPAHELMWRTNEAGGGPACRTWNESTRSPGRRSRSCSRYGCELLYVGDIERKKYQVNLPSSGIESIYDWNGVQIYRLSTPS